MYVNMCMYVNIYVCICTSIYDIYIHHYDPF